METPDFTNKTALSDTARHQAELARRNPRFRTKPLLRSVWRVTALSGTRPSRSALGLRARVPASASAFARGHASSHSLIFHELCSMGYRPRPVESTDHIHSSRPNLRALRRWFLRPPRSGNQRQFLNFHVIESTLEQ